MMKWKVGSHVSRDGPETQVGTGTGTDVYSTTCTVHKCRFLVFISGLHFKQVNHLFLVQFCSTVLANHFTFPAIVGGLIKERVGGASVKNAEGETTKSLAAFCNKRFYFNNLKDKSDMSNTLKKTVAMAISGEICVYFSVCENRQCCTADVIKKEIKDLRKIQGLSFTLSHCFVTSFGKNRPIFVFLKP